MIQELRTETTVPRWLQIVILALLLATFAVRNLPWHLDDYDQAKQAFVSFEMVQDGQWWFQHTPDIKIATKPPLAGWISAGLYLLFGGNGWDFAWRLPAFVSALILLTLLWRSGRELAGSRGAIIAVCAFGFNLTAPRLATLVRTDMMLALFIFLAGWLIFEKVRTGTPWTGREKLGLGFAVLGSMLVKGPILYAFLLPGLVAFLLFNRRRGGARLAWSGWTPWVLPLLVFGLWVGIGVWLSRDFYEQVVLREFLGRFDMSDAPVHRHQPLWFYFVHVFHKWAPWSVALVALCFSRQVRHRLREDPALLWLACWALGGLIFMSLVPSKRVDRIFPIIPPLSLLLAALFNQWYSRRGERPARLFPALVTVGILVGAGYTTVMVVNSFRSNQRSLIQLTARVAEITAAHPERLAVLSSDDEGLLLYTKRTRFAKMDAVEPAWKRGELDYVFLDASTLKRHKAKFEPFATVIETDRLKGKRGPYFLLRRTAPPAP